MRKVGNRHNKDIKAKCMEMHRTGEYTMMEISSILNVSMDSVGRWLNKYYGKGEQNQYGLKSKV